MRQVVVRYQIAARECGGLSLLEVPEFSAWVAAPSATSLNWMHSLARHITLFVARPFSTTVRIRMKYSSDGLPCYKYVFQRKRPGFMLGAMCPDVYLVA